MVLLTPKTELIEKYAKLYRFNLKEELSIKSGGLDFKVLKLNKKSFK
jgi:hypothetical protein